jgi:hypothetical protein
MNDPKKVALCLGLLVSGCAAAAPLAPAPDPSLGAVASPAPPAPPPPPVPAPPAPASFFPVPEPQPQPDAPADTPVALPEPDFEKIADPVARDTLRFAVAEARGVISSASFRRHLMALTRLDAHAGELPTTGAAVAELYLGLEGVPRQYPTTYLVSGEGCGTSTASTRIDGSSRTATTTLRGCTIERASAYPLTREESVEKFACAVNTIAHEWTHAIPEPGKPGVWLYKDDGHRDVTVAIVSYTVGSIAQCAYLDAHGFRVEEKFDECVRLVGKTVFNTGTCATSSSRGPGWAEKTFGRR